MSALGDYQREMLGIPISDADAEALLTGREPSDGELLGLYVALNRIDLERLGIRVDERAGVFSLRAAALARQSAASTYSVPWWRRVAPKLAVSALSLFVVVGLSGVAMAADAAAPGDFFYGVDQALEHIGINAGGLTERLKEAAKLAEHGQAVEALRHAAEAVSSQSPEAASALELAVEKVGIGQGVPEDVAAMLEWMSTSDVTGSEFGQGVAERARELGEGHRNDTPGIGPSEDQGNPDVESGKRDDETTPSNDNENQRVNGSNGNPGNSGNPNSNGAGNSGSNGHGGGPPGGTPPGQTGR